MAKEICIQGRKVMIKINGVQVAVASLFTCSAIRVLTDHYLFYKKVECICIMSMQRELLFSR